MYDKSHAFAWLLVPLRNNLSVVVLALLILVLVLAVLLVLVLIVLLILVLIVLLILVLILIVHYYTAFSQKIFEGSSGKESSVISVIPSDTSTKGTRIVCAGQAELYSHSLDIFH